MYFGLAFDASDTAAGGDGTDTIGIADGADLTLTSGAKATGFEALDIRGTSNTTYDLDFLSGITNVIVGATLNAGGVGHIATLNDIAVGATVTVKAAVGDDTTDALKINQKNAGVGSPDDAITVIVDAAAGITTTGIIDINDIETVTVNTTSSEESQTQQLQDLMQMKQQVLKSMQQLQKQPFQL